MKQKEALSDPADPRDVQSYNVDSVLESPLSNNDAETFETAYYNYAKSGGETVLKPGCSYLVSLSYLIVEKIGPGKLQPNVRFQWFEPKGEGLRPLGVMVLA